MKTIEKLEVKVLGRTVGTLAPSSQPSGYVFTYLPDAPEAYFVSLTMPVRAASYEWAEGLPPFFQMNLPEGALKEIIRERLGPNMPVDDYHMLALTGAKGIGRVDVSPWGEPDRGTPSTLDIAKILAHKDSREALLHAIAETDLHQMGISGVMPKLLAPTEKLTLVSGDWILKTGREDTPGIAINEFLCMRLAKEMGLPVPTLKLSKDGNVLAVLRFDKDFNGVALGLEDFCALTGNSPLEKYDVSMERLADSLKALCANSQIVESSKRLIDMIVLNLVVRNADAHSKNFSLFYSSTEDARLSPVYDIVTAHAYQKFAKNNFALTIGGNRSWALRKQLDRFCTQRLGLPASHVTDAMDRIAAGMTRVVPEIQEYADQYPQFRETGKRMLKLWEEGLHTTSDTQVIATNVDFSAPKLSEPQKEKKKPQSPYSSNPWKMN